eukprot:1745133-Amphidinium_carterae.2
MQRKVSTLCRSSASILLPKSLRPSSSSQLPLPVVVGIPISNLDASPAPYVCKLAKHRQENHLSRFTLTVGKESTWQQILTSEA